MDLSTVVHLEDTEFQASWKEVYGKYYSSVPRHTVLTNRLKKTTKFRNLGMDGIRFGVQMGIGGTTANMPDASRYPRGAKPRTKQGLTDVVWIYTGFELGGQAVAKSDNNKAGLYVDVVEENTRAAILRGKLEVERQMNSDGSGILAVVSSVSGAPTYGLEKPYGLTNGGNGTMCITEDMDIAFINPGDDSERGRTTIDSYDPDEQEIDCSSSPAGVQIGDYVVRVNSAAYTGTDRTKNLDAEIAGIVAWTGTGDEFEGINGGTERRWNGNQMLNGGNARSISEKLVSQAEATIWSKTGREDSDILWYTSPFIRLELASQLAARVNNTGGITWKVKGGFRYAEINGRDIAASPKCPRGRLFGLCVNADVAGLMELPQGFLGEGERQAKLRWREEYHTAKSDMVIPVGTIVFQRNAHILVGDLTDSNDYTDN